MAVRKGDLSPADALERSLALIAELDGDIGAFVSTRAEKARAEAEELGGRGDLVDLPLAGVPLAIKDNLDVRGEATRDGSKATDPAPVGSDHPAVERLKRAGAIIVGKTRLPELGIWGSTEDHQGVTRNPWDLTRTPGGSSGGSAAAVAAGMVPVAVGTDGLGSIRIPAAACGVFGIKPGAGVVPSLVGKSSWNGMTENGPLTTCVEDARLILSVMAGTPLPASGKDRSMRIALSTKAPVGGTRVARSRRSVVTSAGEVCASLGHRIEISDPPYRLRDVIPVATYWTGGVAEDAKGLPSDRLEARTRGHIRAARILMKAGPRAARRREDWRRRAETFFERFDVLLLPALAQEPPLLAQRDRLGWARNVWQDANYAPFAALWNFASLPAAVLPWGLDDRGLPLSVQAVAGWGDEAVLLELAEQLEAAHPWQRHAPAAAARD